MPNGGGNRVEVVEQPLGRGRGGFLPRIAREGRVDVPQRAHVRVQLPEVGTAAPATRRRNREQRSQAAGVLLQQIDAQQLFAAGKRTCSSEWRNHFASYIGLHDEGVPKSTDDLAVGG
jgi:hypothetical protein